MRGWLKAWAFLGPGLDVGRHADHGSGRDATRATLSGLVGAFTGFQVFRSLVGAFEA